MGFTEKTKSKMGLLLVFFPEDDNTTAAATATTTTAIVDKSNLLIKRTNSSLLFTKAQSTISICALLVFLTLLLFTLSTFEPTIPTPTTTSTTIRTPRRFLSQKPQKPVPLFSFLWNNKYKNKQMNEQEPFSIALQGMGTLYRRGTRAMNDLVVAHVVEDVKEDEFRVFLRALHRSGLTAKADIAFLFESSSSSSSSNHKFNSVIKEENDSFLKLIHHYRELSNTTTNHHHHRRSVMSFDVNQFIKSGTKLEIAEPLWGKKARTNYSSNNNSSDSVEENGVVQKESIQETYGSILGFEVSELDPENSLSGFVDHIPMSLRRWACYPMLLGRVRRNFKHILLIDVKKLVLLGDPLVRVRTHSAESVYISMSTATITSSKHGKRNSDKTQSHHSVNSAILMGGARGVRRLSNAMLTEIVRAAMQHKKKNSVTESGILSQLVGNHHILKNVNLITSTESIPDASSLTGSTTSQGSVIVIQRGGNSNNNNNNNHDFDSIIMKQICSCEVDSSSSVYKNC